MLTVPDPPSNGNACVRAPGSPGTATIAVGAPSPPGDWETLDRECPVTPLLRCDPRIGATTVSSMDGHIWRWAGNIPPGFEPEFEPRLAVQTKLPLRHGDRLTFRRWDADFNNCASKGQLNGLLANRAVPTVQTMTSRTK